MLRDRDREVKILENSWQFSRNEILQQNYSTRRRRWPTSKMTSPTWRQHRLYVEGWRPGGGPWRGWVRGHWWHGGQIWGGVEVHFFVDIPDNKHNMFNIKICVKKFRIHQLYVSLLQLAKVVIFICNHKLELEEMAHKWNLKGWLVMSKLLQRERESDHWSRNL